MLNDTHVTVPFYEEDSKKVFPGLETPIKGGVAVTIRNANKEYGAMEHFITDPIMRSILQKTLKKITHRLSEIVYSKSTYNLTDKVYADYPEIVGRLTKGNEHIVDAKIFEKMPEIFTERPERDSIKVYGRGKNGRIQKYILSEYIKPNSNLDHYKVIVAGVNGVGVLSETLSDPFVAAPRTCHTQTFMSIGIFSTEQEALNCLKYIKTKYARTLWHTLKVTQNNAKSTWRNIPLQEFSPSSDIDWSKSIKEIDQQLYKKYGLSEEEINFIETHVKEME